MGLKLEQVSISYAPSEKITPEYKWLEEWREPVTRAEC